MKAKKKLFHKLNSLQNNSFNFGFYSCIEIILPLNLPLDAIEFSFAFKTFALI